MGGAAAVNLTIQMLRTKFAAVLIGTGGIGLLAIYTSIQSVIGTVAGLGIQSSAVRDIASAVTKEDEQAIGRAVKARLMYFAAPDICTATAIGMVINKYGQMWIKLSMMYSSIARMWDMFTSSYYRKLMRKESLDS